VGVDSQWSHSVDNQQEEEEEAVDSPCSHQLDSHQEEEEEVDSPCSHPVDIQEEEEGAVDSHLHLEVEGYLWVEEEEQCFRFRPHKEQS